MAATVLCCPVCHQPMTPAANGEVCCNVCATLFQLVPVPVGTELPASVDARKTVGYQPTGAHDPGDARAPAGYQIERELGRGGMGVVYLARQQRLHRLCALKVIRSDEHANDHEKERFEAEARAVAALQHPHIVQVYEIGEHLGRPFMALELCPGGSLDEKLRDRPPTPTEAAAIVRNLALAMQAAHDARVLHWDLKPANVLFTADGTVKVTDFGLAKRLDEAGQTQTGAVVGTPSYMPPEQARGDKELGPAVDVYALGAILYTALSGRPPFRGATVAETIHRVLHDEVVPVRQLNPSVPRDLETICHKCLRKEAPHRYLTARELADDLDRFLGGRPVLARPVGPVERLFGWARRHPAGAALVFVSLAALAAMVGGGLYFTNQLQAAVWALEAENTRATTGERLAREEEERARRERTRAEHELDRSRRLLMTTRLVQAGALGERDPNAALELLHDTQACPHDLRDFTWRLLKKQFHRERLSLHASFQNFTWASLSDDGLLLATDSETRQALVWDTLTGRKRELSPGPVGVVSFRPGTREVFAAENQAVSVWDATTGKKLRTLPGSASQLSFSRDGRLLATVWNQEITLRDAATGERLRTLSRHTKSIHCVAFSPDGRSLASASADATVRTWDVTTGAEAAVFDRQPGPPLAVAWLDKGRQLGVSIGLADGKPASVRLLDAATGAERRVIQGFLGEVWALAASPDGMRLAGGTGGTYSGGNELPGEIILWKVATDEPPLTLSGHQGGIHSLSFSADGDYLAAGSGGADRQGGLSGGTVKLWFVGPSRGRSAPEPDRSTIQALWLTPDGLVVTASQKRIASRDGTTGEVRGSVELRPVEDRTLLAGSPDGRSVVYATNRFQLIGEVSIRDAGHDEDRVTLPKQRMEPSAAAYSPDGRMLAVAYPTGLVRVVDPAGRDIRVFEAVHPSGVNSVSFSPDGKFLATGGAQGRTQQGEVALWEVDTGRQVWAGLGHPFRVSSLAFSADGRRLASGDRAQTVMLWDVETGRSRGVTRKHSGEVTCLAFSPDGQTLASASDSPNRLADLGEILFWDVVTCEVRASLQSPHRLSRMAFSADGRRLITASLGGRITFWDAPDPIDRAVLSAHTQLVWSMDVTPDSGLLTTAGRDDTVKVWDLKTGKERLSLGGESGMCWSAVVAPDGNLLATTTETGLVRLWNLEGQQLAALKGHNGRITRLAFSPDGRLLASCGSVSEGMASIHLWDVRTRERVFATPALPGTVEAVAWGSDGGTLISGHSDGTLRWWGVREKGERRVVKAHKSAIASLAVSADGRSFLTGSRDRSIKRWDEGGREVSTLPTDREVYSVALSPDGSLLAWAGWDPVVRVWQASDGAPVAVLSGHTRPVSRVLFTPDGTTLISGDYRGTIRTWDVNRLKDSSR